MRIPLACLAVMLTLQVLPSLPMKNDVQAGMLAGIPSGKTRVIDLTYAISDKLPGWPGGKEPAFSASVLATVPEQGYFARKFSMVEHYGTHMDAPQHFAPQRYSLEQIPARQFFGPAVVIDVRSEVAKDSDYRLPVEAVRQWEEKHGRIPEGAIVLLNTGWASRWPDAARYSNMDSKGVMHYPAYSAEAAKVLLERKVSGLGIDTYGIDYGPSRTYDVHHLVLEADVYALENLSDLSGIPESGAYIVAAPIKLEGGSGGPCRVFAILPQ